jgi:hypothetical protein
LAGVAAKGTERATGSPAVPQPGGNPFAASRVAPFVL